MPALVYLAPALNAAFNPHSSLGTACWRRQVFRRGQNSLSNSMSLKVALLCYMRSLLPAQDQDLLNFAPMRDRASQ